jgi:hypothetical protein
VTARDAVQKFLSRSRRLTLGELKTLLIPRRIDEYLYESHGPPCDVLHTVPQKTSIHRYPNASVAGTTRTADGRIVYLMVEHDTGALIHSSTVSFETLLPARFGYDESVPVIGHCRTVAKYRGHRVYPYVLCYVLKDLRQSGLATSVYMLVSAENRASIRGIERAGFKRIARLRALKFAGLLIRKHAHTTQS